MRLRLQLGKCSLLLWLSAAVCAPSWAQHGRPSPPPPQRPPSAAPRNNPNRPPQAQQRQLPPANRPAGAGNPQGNNGKHPEVQRPNNQVPGLNNPNRQSGANQTARKFNELSPQDKQRVLENNRKYQNLSPAQKQQLKENLATWNRLTPAQKDHIRNDILPKWKDMPVERRQAIRQRLQILQNMPESAKNQRLNDPNFTRGMSEEDKTTLRDLTHMHVGAPDPPGE